ncbi:hypothetical protein TCAL_07161 [Tigriopus californicus]|uniref:J domain-containing protein n=2 Tax=Tigriopus californicus TaxID=6832 RepID=A0A553NFG8_TIGCA|nr:hypothetical protein TCAL_07161 [Tigriopus californicus]|eukprot:TCALIF_07161-PA protein Name:"Similar to DNAJC7 DnaJ homolog subfamily C member 7 (Homo sapiens)" AED:0.33 eAED:0.41 QI:0/-1/0/1/-1/1/1/0/783
MTSSPVWVAPIEVIPPPWVPESVAPFLTTPVISYPSSEPLFGSQLVSQLDKAQELAQLLDSRPNSPVLFGQVTPEILRPLSPVMTWAQPSGPPIPAYSRVSPSTVPPSSSLSESSVDPPPCVDTPPASPSGPAGDLTAPTSLVDEGEEVDSGTGVNYTKKTRLEMRREARKTKKVARKRYKMANVSTSVTRHVNEVETESKTPPTTSTKDQVAVSKTEAEVVNSQPDPVIERSESRESLASVIEVRQLTKRQKKQEERRIQNAMRKKQKKEKQKVQYTEDYMRQKTQTKELLSERKPLECAVALTKLMKVNPKDPELYERRRDCYLALDKIYQALADAQTAVELSDSTDACYRLLEICFRTGHALKASEIRLRLSDDLLSPEDAKKCDVMVEAFNETNSLLDASKWTEAITALSQCEIICPEGHYYLILRCECLLHCRKYAEAKNVLLRLRPHEDLQVDLRYLQSLYDYYTDASSWSNEDKFTELSSALKECARLGKTRYQATESNLRKMRNLYHRAEQEMAKDDKSVAKSILQSALNVDPLHSLFMSEIHYLLSMLQSSIEDKLKDLNLSLRFKESRLAFLERGKLFRHKNLVYQAIENFESALKFDPECVSTIHLLERCQIELSVKQKKHIRTPFRNNDHYALLNISSNASTEEIKKAYHAKLTELCPDNQNDLSAEDRENCKIILDALSQAHSTLINTKRRRLYDKERKRCTSSDVDSDYSEDDFASDGEEVRPGSSLGSAEASGAVGGTLESNAAYLKRIMKSMVELGLDPKKTQRRKK